MDTPVPPGLAAPLERLIALARQDPELADALRQTALAVLALLGEPMTQATPAQAAPDPIAPATIAPATMIPATTPPAGEVLEGQGLALEVPGFPRPEAAQPEDIDRLLSGFGRAAGTAPETTWDDAPEFKPDFEPEAVAANLRLKAAACRWLAEHGYTDDRAALLERFRLIDLGRARSSYLWMLDPRAVNPAASSLHVRLAELFETTAEALALWQACEGEAEEEDAARLLAEAQRALHAAITEALGPDGYDRDQHAVHDELRDFARLNGVALEALRLGTVPQPHESLLERFHALAARRDARLAARRDRERHLKRLSYHARLLQRGSHNPAHDLAKVLGALRDLTAGGLPESALALDTPLRPILMELGKSGDPLAARVAAFIAARGQGAAIRVDVPEETSADTLALAQFIGGRTVLMIGGTPRPEARAKIERALSCRLEWLASKPHQSHYDFAAPIARPEVALVLLLIRWSSHGFAEILSFCREHRKPLVRVPSGYGVNSLARAVLGQVSQQLAQE